MQDCGIKGVWLSEQSGIAEATISKFIQDKSDVRASTVERIIDGLPPEAREYFFNLLYPRTNNMKTLLQDATQEEKIEALRIVAASMEDMNNKPTERNAKKTLTLTRESVPV